MHSEIRSDLHCSPFALREKGVGGMRVKCAISNSLPGVTVTNEEATNNL